MTTATHTATLAIRVQPGARREGVVGRYGDALKVAINAPAVDGKANDALIRLLANLLSIPRSSIDIVSGHTSRSKLLRLTLPVSTTTAELETRLLPPD